MLAPTPLNLISGGAVLPPLRYIRSSPGRASSNVTPRLAGGFPKLRVPFLGSLIIRVLVLFGIPYSGKLPFSA